jgi:hypothetical protein
MKRPVIAVAAASLMATALAAPTIARAGDGGAVAAGAAGGLLGGMLLGSALAPHPYYYEPAPVYAEPPPPPYRCYWTYGRLYWDDWRGVWVRPRIHVCD